MGTATAGRTAVMPSTNYKYTTLAQLELSDKGPVFIINTAESADGQKGTLLINVPKKNGNGSDLVRIPKTFIPIDLTEQVTRSQLMEAAEFRKAVSNQQLRLLTPEYAAVLLEAPEARAERTRIVNEVKMARAALQGAGVTDTDEDETFDPDEVRSGKKKAQAAAEDEKPKKAPINQRLVQLVADAESENWNQTKILAEIRRHGDMKKNEIRYLGSKFKEQTRVLDFLEEAYNNA